MRRGLEALDPGQFFLLAALSLPRLVPQCLPLLSVPDPVS